MNQNNQWIDVKFKMPETSVAVICKGSLDGKKNVFAGWWDDAKDLTEWYCFSMDWCTSCHNPETIVTHWMPYPEE